MNLSNLQSIFGGGNQGGASVQNVTGSAAVQLHTNADTVFVDVRGPEEIAYTGTIKGAIRAPLPEFATHADPSGAGRLPAADAGKTIIVVCASGARSNAAAQQLIRLGYPDVGNINGGIGQWKMAGGAMEK